MPTYDQIQELLDNTTSTWTTQNGVEGRLFTASNGNSIFLPAAGVRQWDDNLYYAGEYGNYWSSTQDPDKSFFAYELGFISDFADWDCGARCGGQSVRPVLRK